MTSSQPTPTAASFVAIDVAKIRNEVLIEGPDTQRRRRLTVTNTRGEHERLLAALQTLRRPIIIGLEPTGHYHRPLAWRLVEAGFDVRLISSVALARTREALHNGWDKNHRQFLKFCGLDLAAHQCGQFRGKAKLSKRGNARLRRALWMTAQVAIRQRENSLRAKFERDVAKDRDDPHLRRKAFTAITAKMAASCTRSSSAVSITGPSLRRRYQVDEPLSVGAVRAHPRPCR